MSLGVLGMSQTNEIEMLCMALVKDHKKNFYYTKALLLTCGPAKWFLQQRREVILNSKHSITNYQFTIKDQFRKLTKGKHRDVTGVHLNLTNSMNLSSWQVRVVGVTSAIVEEKKLFRCEISSAIKDSISYLLCIVSYTQN